MTNNLLLFMFIAAILTMGFLLFGYLIMKFLLVLIALGVGYLIGKFDK